MESLEKILEIGGIEMEDSDKEELASTKNTWFLESLNQMTPDEVLPGVHSLLDDLDSVGIKRAIGSASKNAKLALEKVEIIDRFDAVVDGTMVGNAKPSPEVFLMAASILDVPPSECMVFEDAIAGVEAAHKGGMKCIAIGNESVLGNADLVVPSLEGYSWQRLLDLI